ncbi:hypothetical protein HaLaN_25260, partial [Haematococcus lacustris]
MSVAAADIYCMDAYGGRLASINTDAEYAAAHCQNFLINNTVAFRDPDVPRAFLCKTPTY